jgi:hypothetical protein
MREVREFVEDLTGMWSPDADEGRLREAARAWKAFAEDVGDVIAGTSPKARALVENNKGDSIEAFDEFWRRYYHGGRGWLKDLSDAARDMAEALDQYADAVNEANARIDHELMIQAGVLAAGIGLAFFTFGASAAAAEAAAWAIAEVAAELGVAVTAEVATIAGTTLTGVVFGGLESVTVDLAVAQPARIALGDQQGLNLDEVHDAAVFGGFTGGAFGGGAWAYRVLKDAGGTRNLFQGMPIDVSGPRLALAGNTESPPGSSLALRTADGGTEGGSRGTYGPGEWTAQADMKGPAAGKVLKRPHSRHTPGGAAHAGKHVEKKNSVILRGYSKQVDADIEGIANGQAKYIKETDRYEINGRTYGIEPSGRVYPDSGPGIAVLDRNEYAALQQIAQAKGDVSAAPQLSKNPRFVNNPEAVQKALDIYNGTHP